ncbi:MAG: hypothetical protein H6816_01590 [Phycisphaerales bacterium]|nr:hypothetical protein [Phycisphaerales bacterium]
MTAEYDRTRGISSTPEPASANDQRGNGVDDSSFAHLRDNIIEALRILALRRWTFFIPFCIVTSAVAIGSHWIKRTYRATTVVERRDHPVLMNLRQTAATGEFSRFFRPTLVRDIKSMETMMEVVENLDLVDTGPEDAPKTADTVRAIRHKAASLIGGVNAFVVQKAEHYDEINISYEGTEPYLPRRIVQEVTNVYERRMRATLVAMLTEGMSYFQKAADESRNEISQLEEDILRFEAQYTGVDPTDPGALKLKLTSLESEQQELDRTIEGLAGEVAARKTLIAAYEERAQQQAESRVQAAQALANQGATIAIPNVPKSAAATALEQEIRDLQNEIHELQLTRRMTDLHPDIVDRRNRIGRLRERLKEQYLADASTANRGAELTDSDASVAVERAVGTDMELLNLRLELQDREGRLASAQSRQRIVESDITKHRELQKNVFHYRRDYQVKSDQLTQARKDHAKNMERVNEISSILNADESQRGVSFTVRAAPSGGISPVRPQAAMVLICALLAGIAFGAIAVLIQEVFDQTYHTARQITRSLGISILETIDEIVTSADRARQFRRRVIYAPAIVTVLAAIVGVCCVAAYLSLADPLTYQRAMNGPCHYLHRLQGSTAGVLPSAAPPPAAEDARTTRPAVAFSTFDYEDDVADILAASAAHKDD